MMKKIIIISVMLLLVMLIAVACDELGEVSSDIRTATWSEYGMEWETLYRYECETGLIGYVDTSGEVIIEPQFYGGHRFSEGLAFVIGVPGREDQTGFIDLEGNLVIPLPTALAAGRFSEGFAAVNIREWERPNPFIDGTLGPYVIIDRTGQDVFDQEFLWVRSFENGFARVMLLNGTEHYIDRNGNIVRNKP